MQLPETKRTFAPRSRLAVRRLTRLFSFHTGEKDRSFQIQCVANAIQDINSGRLLVVLQLADVRSIHVGLKCQLFLSEPRSKSGFTQFLAKHAARVT